MFIIAQLLGRCRTLCWWKSPSSFCCMTYTQFEAVVNTPETCFSKFEGLLTLHDLQRQSCLPSCEHSTPQTSGTTCRSFHMTLPLWAVSQGWRSTCGEISERRGSLRTQSASREEGHYWGVKVIGSTHTIQWTVHCTPVVPCAVYLLRRDCLLEMELHCLQFGMQGFCCWMIHDGDQRPPAPSWWRHLQVFYQ